MRSLIPNSEITRSTIAVCVSIILICFIFVGIIYIDFRQSLQREIDRIEEVRNDNNDYIRIVKLKSKLSAIIRKVTFTCFITHSNILMNRDGHVDFDNSKNIKRIKTWEKEIQPVLDTIDIHMDDGYADDIRGTFNKINDKIIEIYLLQKELSFDAKNDTPANLINLEELKRHTHSLAESYNKFLEDSREANLSYHSKTDFFRDDTVLLVSLLLITLTLIVAIVYYFIRYLHAQIKEIELFLGEIRKGVLPKILDLRGNDFLSTKKSLNYILLKLNKISAYSERVSIGDFSLVKSVEIERDGDFGNSLSDMQYSLVEVSQREKEREHVNKGLGTFSDVLSSTTNDVNLFAEEVVKNLVKFLNANQGALFIVKSNGSDETLDLNYCYAYNKQKYLDKSIKRGQGIIGQAWLEKERIYMTEIPDMYTDITSGLGESTPRCILVIPLVFNDVVQGIIELASFNLLKDYELSFIDEVIGSISSSLASVMIHSRTNEYLRQSEELTLMMKDQEDFMKIKVGELALIQEESKSKEERYIREIKRLKKRLQAYERHN